MNDNGGRYDSAAAKRRYLGLNLVLSSGKFVAVRGTVVRVSNVRPLVRVGEFECNKCGALQVGAHLTERLPVTVACSDVPFLC